MPLVQLNDKKGAYARIGLIGVSGSGKSWTSLELAQGLSDGKTIAVIDTERSSLNKYYGEIGASGSPFQFSPWSPPLEDFAPENYTRAIEEISKLPDVGVLIIDSLSHAWSGKGGALEKVNNAAKRSQSGNSYAAWRDVTPLHNRLIDTMLSVPFHLIVTIRAKTEYVIEVDERTKKSSIRKVGLAPVQRDGMEYEFDIVGDINQEHELIVSKTRMRSLKDAVIKEPDYQLGIKILDWCTNTPSVPVQQPMIDRDRTDDELRELIALAKAHNKTSEWLTGVCKGEYNKSPRSLSTLEFNAIKDHLTTHTESGS